MRLSKIIGFIVLTMVVCASASTVSASVNVSINSATVDPGNTTTVDITAHNVTELGEFGIKLEYDTNVVSVTGVQNDPAIPDSFGVSDTTDDGSLSLVSSGMTKPSLTGAEVLLVTVTLKAVGDAGDECDLDITVSTLKYNNGTAIDATDEDGVFKIAGDAAVSPTCTVSVTNTTITPPQPTDITVTFSEYVHYILNIETDDGTVVRDWSGDRKTSRTVTWDGTYETDGTQVLDGTYTVNLTVTNETTGLSGNNRTETIVVSSGDDDVTPVTYISIDSATVDPGNTTTVDITAHNVTELGEFGIKLEYDTNVVSVTGVQNNPEIPDSFGVSDTTDDGSLSLVSSGMTKPSLTGAEVLLVTVTLQAVGDASDECDLNITICTFKYNNGTDIDATDEDGVFEIRDEGVMNTYYGDADGDGYGDPANTTEACSAPAGYVENDDDCDDANAAVNPGATEILNGIDDDCDGQIDEGFCTGDFYIKLDAGWNLVSVPKRIDGANDAATVFNLDPLNETCEYYNASAGSSMDLVDICVVQCQGYWVYKVSPETICIDFKESTGAIPPPTQQLYAGWNMIGHIDTSDMPIDDGTGTDFGSMANIEGKFSQIWQWTQGNGWESCYPSGLNNMTSGQGYWIWMTEDVMMSGTP